MENSKKTKAQLLNELRDLRHRFAELEISDSKLKGAEKALGDSEKNFFQSFRTSPDFIVISTLADACYVEVNDSFLQATGYRREEVIGHTAHELKIWADLAERDMFVQKLQEQRTVHDFETSYRKKSGEVGWVLMSAELIEIAAEQCVLSVLKDITERKRIEKELGRVVGREKAKAYYRKKKGQKEKVKKRLFGWL